MSPKRHSRCRVARRVRAAAEMHEPDRLGGAAAARTGDAGDGYGDVGVRMRERALGHGAGDRLADGAVRGDQVGRHAEHSILASLE